MALTPKELKQWVLDKINAGRLSWTAQNDVSFNRGLHFKFDQQLLDGIELYKNKYQKIVEFYKEYLDEIQGKIANFDISKAELKTDLLFMKDKVLRIADKYWAIKREIEGRRLDIFKRNPVGTVYYIDLDNGDDANDGLSPDQAWKNLEKYTMVTVRSPGDIAKVRANTTQIKTDADIVMDENGNMNDRIEIRGCSSSDDPWGDGSDIRPILTFNNTNYQVYPSFDDWWKISRLIFKESDHVTGNVYFYGSIGWHLIDCDFMDSGTQPTDLRYGLQLGNNNRMFLIENCLFENNKRYNFLALNSNAKLIKCTFNGGAIGTWYGLASESYAVLEVIDCNFGQDTPHTYHDVNANHVSIIKLRNCKRAGTILIIGTGSVYEEDVNGVYGSYKTVYHHGTVTKDTNIKTGNADFSCKIEPNSDCGIYSPLTLNNDSLISHPFNILCTADIEKTVTIKIRSLGTWSAYPTNTELYVEFSYLSNGASAARTKIASTQVLSHSSDWVSFAVTFTPLQTGIAYGTVYLKKYEAAKGCYVNMEAT